MQTHTHTHLFLSGVEARLAALQLLLPAAPVGVLRHVLRLLDQLRRLHALHGDDVEGVQVLEAPGRDATLMHREAYTVKEHHQQLHIFILNKKAFLVLVPVTKDTLFSTVCYMYLLFMIFICLFYDVYWMCRLVFANHIGGQ